MKSDDSVLVIGCGNSDFSSQLYDAGYPHITNIDFSTAVIEEMRSKHSTTRPSMKWEVADMTTMRFESPFRCIFDKGALDALFSTDTPELAHKATEMFQRIDEALVEGGVYMCVSLAEPFILRSLLRHFSSVGYGVTIESISTTRPSPFTPFLISARKPLTTATSTAGEIRVSFSSYLHQSSASAGPCGLEEALAAVAHVQSYSQTRHDLSDIEPGRVRTLHFYDPSNTSSHVPRFSIIVIDISLSRAAPGSRTCAVFFIPRGRESEYHFSTAEGLRDIAQQAKCQRLMAVCCNRPHVFSENMQELQDELSPLVMALVPRSYKPDDEEIPYMATGESSEWEALEYGESSLAGEFVIEEKPCSSSTAVVRYSYCFRSVLMKYRRLVFMNNQHIIQTECRMTQRRTAKSGKGKKKATKRTDAEEDCMAMDINVLDSHHCSMLLAMALCDNLILKASRFRNSKAANDGAKCLLIGLGGGALVMALQKYLPSLHIDAVELVPELVEVAKKYFGYVPGPLTNTIVADGLDVINGRYSTTPADTACIILDIDNKDAAASGVSAPPPAFVTDASLSHMHSLLCEDGGLLIVNAAARTPAALDSIVRSMQRVFGGSVVAIRGSDETTNVTLVGIRGDTSIMVRDRTAAVKLIGKVLDKWLNELGMAADPLELRELLSNIEIRQSEVI